VRRAMRQVELVRAVLLGPGAVQAGIVAGYGPAAAWRLMWWGAPRKLSFYFLGGSPANAEACMLNPFILNRESRDGPPAAGATRGRPFVFATFAARFVPSALVRRVSVDLTQKFIARGLAVHTAQLQLVIPRSPQFPPDAPHPVLPTTVAQPVRSPRFQAPIRAAPAAPAACSDDSMLRVRQVGAGVVLACSARR